MQRLLVAWHFTAAPAVTLNRVAKETSKNRTTENGTIGWQPGEILLIHETCFAAAAGRFFCLRRLMSHTLILGIFSADEPCSHHMILCQGLFHPRDFQKLLLLLLLDCLEHLAKISAHHAGTTPNQPQSPKVQKLKFGDVSFDFGFEW